MVPSSVLAINFIAVVVMVLAGKIVSLIHKNVTVADSLWGLGFVLVAWLTFAMSDGFAGWRKRSGRRFWLVSLFKVFLLQSVFLWAIALALQLGQLPREPAHLTLLDYSGAILWAIGFFLSRWRPATGQIQSKPGQ